MRISIAIKRKSCSQLFKRSLYLKLRIVISSKKLHKARNYSRLYYFLNWWIPLYETEIIRINPMIFNRRYINQKRNIESKLGEILPKHELYSLTYWKELTELSCGFELQGSIIWPNPSNHCGKAFQLEKEQRIIIPHCFFLTWSNKLFDHQLNKSPQVYLVVPTKSWSNPLSNTIKCIDIRNHSHHQNISWSYYIPWS